MVIVSGVRYAYQGRRALGEVSLALERGVHTVVTGTNGSGKSTLSYAVAGHPKYTVTSGSITLDGQLFRFQAGKEIQQVDRRQDRDAEHDIGKLRYGRIGQPPFQIVLPQRHQGRHHDGGALAMRVVGHLVEGGQQRLAPPVRRGARGGSAGRSRAPMRVT